MPLAVQRLHPRFFGEITGADLAQEPTAELIEFVEAAMAEHAVCVVRQGAITDEQHLRFARAFGPLEVPPRYEERKHDPNLRMAPELFFAGNLDPQGNILPKVPRKDDVSAGAQRFHADSSFNAKPSKWSMLRGVECPPPKFGGDTLFIDTRAVYDDLPDEMKERIEDLVGIHDFWKGRVYAGLQVTDGMRASMPMPPVRHRIVRQMPDGRKYLFVGGHCTHVEGMDEVEGHALVEQLYRRATRTEYVHRHRWTEGDIVIWENRCALHAATPLSTYEHRRDMRRATVNEQAS